MHLNKGIIPPMVTPLTEEDRLDHIGLEKLIEHLIGGGVHGLFILGTTGEGPSLSYSVRLELIKAVCKQTDGRVPVLVGITDTSYKGTIHVAEKAQKYGAQAVVLAPPFYFHISQSELYQYTDQLLPELPLPVFLYNQPALTKVTFGLDILDDLLPREQVVGVKDSSGDLVYFHKLKKRTDSNNLPLFIGPEELLLDALVVKGAGGVSGGANIFPSMYVALFNAIKKQNVEEGLKLHNKIMQLSEVVYSGSAYGSGNIINGIKTALSYLNICENHVSIPLKNISREKATRIQGLISKEQVNYKM